ncbi:MAG: hypothetical protein Kow00124_24510 [Anaerolineae bacterium]
MSEAGHINGGDAPRVLLVDLSVRLGGASIRGLGLLGGLPPGQAALAGLKGGPVTEAALAAGHEVHIVGSRRTDPRLIGRLAQVIRAGGFHVVDGQNPQSKLWGSQAAEQTGAAFVATLNSWAALEYGGSLKARLYDTLERRIRRVTDMNIAVSPEIAAHLRADGVPDSHIALIPNAVAIEPGAIPDIRARLIEEAGLPPEAVICCAVGRLVEAKGFDTLIASTARIAERLPAFHCVIVGDGHLREELTAQIARLGLESRVQLLGFRSHDEVLAIVKAADLFTMPSRSEGTPVALLEAAGLGKPIAAARVGGIPDVITSGEHGLLVEPGDEEGLAEALLRLAASPEEAARLAAAARARVERDFSLTAQVAATQEAYRRALANRQARSRR